MMVMLSAAGMMWGNYYHSQVEAALSPLLDWIIILDHDIKSEIRE